MDVPSTGKNNLNLNVSKLKIEQKTIVSKLKSTLPQKAIRNPITKSVGYIGGSVGATVKFLAFTLPLTVAGTAIGVTGGAVGGGVGGAFTAAGGFLRGFLGFIAGVEEHMSGGAEMIGEGVALAVGTPFVGLAKGFMIGKNIGSSNALMNQEFKEVTKEIDKKQITKNIGDTELNAFFEKKIITDSEETNATGYIETNAEQLDRILTDPIHTTEKGEKIYIRPFSKNDEAQKAQKNQHFNAVKELKGIETKKDAIEYMKNNERGLFCLESKTFPIVESTDADLRIKLNSILRSNKSDADAMKELSDELDKYHGDIIEKIKNEKLNDKSTEKNDNTTQEISYQSSIKKRGEFKF
ncbi:MAG: hypothetical protein VW397_03195 [Candidatus Margulisiibacteriota bacterium]